MSAKDAQREARLVRLALGVGFLGLAFATHGWTSYLEFGVSICWLLASLAPRGPR